MFIILQSDSRPSGSSDWFTGCWLLRNLRLLFSRFSRSLRRLLSLSSSNCTRVTVPISWFDFHLITDLTLKICLILAACNYYNMGHWSFLWFPSCIIAEWRLVYRVVEYVLKCFQCTSRLCVSSIIMHGICWLNNGGLTTTVTAIVHLFIFCSYNTYIYKKQILILFNYYKPYWQSIYRLHRSWKFTWWLWTTGRHDSKAINWIYS